MSFTNKNSLKELLELPIQEMIKSVMTGAPTDCTWRDVSDWLHNTYSQEDLIEYNLALYKALDRLWDEGLGESEEADNLRDECEAPWYAVDDHDLLNKMISIHLDNKKSGDKF